MNFYDETTDVYQGYMGTNKIFTLSAKLTSDAIRINADIVESLRIAGCEFIEATVEVRPGHFEAFYPKFETFVWEAELVGKDWVYYV